jgi:hypothetical protein
VDAFVVIFEVAFLAKRAAARKTDKIFLGLVNGHHVLVPVLPQGEFFPAGCARELSFPVDR